jgi:hypothetical protein
MKSNTYNGWENYPTWAVYSWLSSNEATYSFIGNMVEELDGLYEAEAAIRNYVELRNPIGDQASMYADLLNFSIGMVNFGEIAKAFLEG